MKNVGFSDKMIIQRLFEALSTNSAYTVMHVTSHEMIVSATAMAPPFHGNLSIDLVSALRTTNLDL